jgi:hypothetical protein
MRHMLATCIAASVLWTAPAFAWNNFRHMEVTAIAWDRLTSATKAKVAKLLERNWLFDEFTDGLAQNDKARIAFITSATWPDIIKRDPGYPSPRDVAELPGHTERRDRGSDGYPGSPNCASVTLAE